MNRRTLLGRFAAIAAAVAVAPAVKAEAALPPVLPVDWRDLGTVTIGEPVTWIRPVGQANPESEPNVWPYWDDAPPTFETMAADCAARGCWLKRYENLRDTKVTYAHKTAPWMPGDPGYQGDSFDPDHLARLDAWRRGLHEQAESPSMFEPEITEASQISSASRRSFYDLVDHSWEAEFWQMANAGGTIKISTEPSVPIGSLSYFRGDAADPPGWRRAPEWDAKVVSIGNDCGGGRLA